MYWTRPSSGSIHLHFVGIGGIGMSGLAEVFFQMGYRVSGSDSHASEQTRKLVDLGIDVKTGHSETNVDNATAIVCSSAIREDNPEFVSAKVRKIPIVPRGELLAELMRDRVSLAVAGTHGKTTTTSMLSSVLIHAGLDPTVVVGGKVDAIGGNAKLGQGQWLVAESDESDGSFLRLPATFAIVTNIDDDHLSFYGNLENLRRAFLQFVGRIPFYGRAVLCSDDPGVRSLLPRVTKPITTYGSDSEADFQLTDFQVWEKGSRFKVNRRGESCGEIALQVPGFHNALNATGAFALAYSLGVSPEKITAGLGLFSGVRRRFETKWISKGITMIDDYAHHPTEIQATLEAARLTYPDSRITAVFQPHRYSRTQQCFSQFPEAFRKADRVFVTDIYQAGESPIEGVTAALLVAACSTYWSNRFEKSKPTFMYAGTLKESAERLSKDLEPKEVILSLGAGNITSFSTLFQPS